MQAWRAFLWMERVPSWPRRCIRRLAGALLRQFARGYVQRRLLLVAVCQSTPIIHIVWLHSFRAFIGHAKQVYSEQNQAHHFLYSQTERPMSRMWIFPLVLLVVKSTFATLDAPSGCTENDGLDFAPSRLASRVR